MKRIFIVFGSLTAILVLVFCLVACGSPKPALKIVDLRALKEEVSTVMQISMPVEIDGQMLQSQYELSQNQIEKFSGIASATMTNTDTFLAVMTKEGNTAMVESAFQKRIEAMKQSLTNNLDAEAEKVKNAKIIKKDDYVFLIITDKVKEVEKIINSRF